LGLFGAAFTEWIGVHVIFGSFLVGIAIGDSPHLEEENRRSIGDFISFFLRPSFSEASVYESISPLSSTSVFPLR
jgi:Kef-type K+ transport system membrane component KefB